MSNDKLIPKLRFPEFGNDGEWEQKRIGDIAKVSAGGTPESTNLDYWNGDIPWMNSGELNNKRIYSVSNFITILGLEKSSTKMIPPKCILIGLAGQGKTRGTAAINYIQLCTNQSIGSIHPNESAFDSEFLYHKIDSMYDELRSLSAGDGGRGGLNLQIIKEIKVLLPYVPEQQKIASCLSTLDEAIAAHSQKLELLKEHKKGLMQNLFPQEGENVPKLRFKEFEKDGEWVEKKLGELVKKVGSGVTPLGGDANYKKVGRPFVRSQNVGWGVFILENIAFIDEPTHLNSINSEIQLNDVLLNITGASIGRSAVANEIVTGGNVNQHVCLIRPILDLLYPQYLNHFLISDLGQMQINSYQAGGNRQGLNFSQIRAFVIPLAPSLHEQQKIASCLTSLDALIAAQAEKIEQLKLHKKGLMQGLFPKIMG